MIERAEALNRDVPNCTFMVNAADDLAVFEDESFDLVCSYLVLQHLPTRGQIFRYVSEFVRVLRPDGLLAFQLLSRISPLDRLDLRRRAYASLRAVGLPGSLLYRRLGLSPIRTQFVPAADMVPFIQARGGHCLEVDSTPLGRQARWSTMYFVSKLSEDRTTGG